MLGIRRMDKVPNTWIWELCGVIKGMDKRIDEDVLHWCSHVERMENDRIAKRFNVCGCGGRQWKKLIDTVKDCLKKRGLNVRQASRVVPDKSVWGGL